MRTIFVDVDTQLDFVVPAGALYVPGSELLAGNWQTLTRFAASNGLTIISTMCAHSENDPEFQIWKPHCVAGTSGQQKLACTVVDKRYTLSTAVKEFDADAASAAQQILVEKLDVDFTNPNLPPLLDLFGQSQFVIYGVATEVCVWYAALRLLERGAQVKIVSDAIRALSSEAGIAAINGLIAKGAQLATTAQIATEQATR